MQLSQNRNPSNTQTVQLFVVSSILVIVVVTLQDLLQAHRGRYAFYLTESFLFNSYWLWFWPIALLYRYFFNWVALSGKGKEVILLFSLGIAASVLHAWMYSLSVFVISYPFYGDAYRIPKMLSYTISNDLYKYIFGYAAVGLWYFRVYSGRPKGESRSPEFIIVGNGRSKIRVPVASIVVIKSSAPYVALHTSVKVHLHTTSLKTLLEDLSPSQFVQIHKSAIVNIDKVVSYRSRLNGDYDIMLETGQEVRLSRNYAAPFKQLLGSGHSS